MSHFRRSSDDGEVCPAERDTLLLLGCLREASDIDPATGECRIWKGMIHVLSCGAQVLGGQVAASAEARADGPCLFYGDLDSHGSSESSHAIRSICEFVHQHGADKPVSPLATLAWVARTAAVPVTLAGCDAAAPVSVMPAQSVMEAMPAFLHGRMKQWQLTQADGAAANAQAQMRHVCDAILQEDGRPDSAVLRENLARVVHERLIQGRLDQAAGLFADAPPLVHTIDAFGLALDALVEPADLPRYRALQRKVGKRGGHAIKSAATRQEGRSRAGAWPGKPGAPVHQGKEGAPNAAPDRHAAARPGRQDTVLEAAISHIASEPAHPAMLLQRACAQGDVDMFAALYRAGGLALFSQSALIRTCGEEAMPPLHLACLVQAPELAAALLHHGADVNQPDRHGKTALHHAVKARSLALIRVLAAANADATIRSDGLTPVELAARTGFDAGVAVLATAGYWQSLKAGNRHSAKAPLS